MIKWPRQCIYGQRMTCCCYIIFSAIPLAQGAAYQSSSSSAVVIANAGAGAAAATDNLANIATNSAIAATFSQPRMAIAGIFVDPHQRVDGRFYSEGDPQSLTSQSIADNYMLPALYFSSPLSEDWAFALATFSNYNLSNRYRADYPAGILAGQRSLFSYEINPNLAVQIRDDLYLGFGFSAIYASYQITGNYGDKNPEPSQQAQDFKSSGSGFRYNIGALYRYSRSSQFGIAYHSASEISTQGPFNARSASDDIMFSNIANLDIAIPDELIFSGRHQLNTRLILQYSLAWYNWANLDALTITSEQCPTANNLNLKASQCFAEPINANDSWKLALGVDYRLTDTILLRGGLASEQDSDSATLAIPFDEQQWFSIGANYTASAALSVDLGISYVRYPEVSINATSTDEQINYQVTGQGNTTLIALQFNYLFL